MDPIESKIDNLVSKFSTLQFRTSFPNENTLYLVREKATLISIIAFALLIQSGLIFVIIENPPFLGVNYQLIYTQTRALNNLYGGENVSEAMKLGNLDHQYWIETIVVIIPLIIGMVGFYLIKKAPSYYEDRNRSNNYMILGLILTITGIFLILTVYGYKLNEELGNYDIFF